MTRGHLTVTGVSNPKKRAAVSDMYLAGVRDGREELKLWKVRFSDMSAAEQEERAARNVEIAEKLLRRVEPGSPNADFLSGQLDFWKNQLKKFRATVSGNKNPKTPTMRELRAEGLRLRIKVSRNADGEYRVGNSEASAYYTDDAADALGTMRAMATDRELARVTGNKNPTFGKRKTGKPKRARVAKKAAPKFGRKKVAGRVNPAPKKRGPVDHVIRATTNSGAVYYYAGFKLSSKLADAARYHDAKYADKVMNDIEERYERALKKLGVKYLDVITA